MGRETKILLGLLGTLAFVFLGALLARLFVARPPVGLGVDVHSNVAVSEPEAIVEPPALGRPGRSAFTAVDRAAVDRAGVDRAAGAGPQGEPPAELSSEASAVVLTAFEQPVEPAQPQASPEPQSQPRQQSLPQTPPPLPLPAAAVARDVRQGTSCTVMTGDAWWSLAEAAYGDGRWYRALYAWNRAIDPAVSLLPGTRLAVPTESELAAAYPGLVPPGVRGGVGR